MMQYAYQGQDKQSGVVSLFLVIFSTLLLTIITVSFINLMTRDQMQATTNDLSQSAYDAAQAGVEDGKRVLLLHQACQAGETTSPVQCARAATALAAQECNTVAAVFGDPNAKETLVQQSTGDADLDQSYTCVKVNPNADDYKGSLSMNETDLIPIRGASAVDTVEISWFSNADLATGSSLSYYSAGIGMVKLPRSDTQWQATNPPLLRTQFMQTGSSFTLNDFDTSSGNTSNANTLFLYPTASAGGLSNLSFPSNDIRQSPTNAPRLARCIPAFGAGQGYACSVRISLPTPVSGAVNTNAFIRLSALYNAANYRITLYNSANPTVVIPSVGVQSTIDSTGRANDLFRRVEARVELRGDFMYPDAAIDITGDLCKDFTITDNPAEYEAAVACTP